MSEKNRVVEKKDLLPTHLYKEKRKKIRRELVEYKKKRRISVGPCASFYFENFKTMCAQIQEMLHIEQGGDDQLKDELNAYNPLIPKGKELVATLMFEIDNPSSRAVFLNKVGGIENTVYLKINEEKILAVPEKDVDRTSDEGKASSVQFVHFYLNDEQIFNFTKISSEILIGVDHKEYFHLTKLSRDNVKSLSEDFN